MQSANDVLNAQQSMELHKNKLLSKEDNILILKKELEHANAKLMESQIKVNSTDTNTMVQQIIDENTKIKNEREIDLLESDRKIYQKDSRINELQNKLLFCDETSLNLKEQLTRQENELNNYRSNMTTIESLQMKLSRVESDLVTCNQINAHSKNLDPCLNKINEIKETLMKDIDEKNETIKEFEKSNETLKQKLNIVTSQLETRNLQSSNDMCLKELEKSRKDYLSLQEINGLLNRDAASYRQIVDERRIDEAVRTREHQRAIDAAAAAAALEAAALASANAAATRAAELAAINAAAELEAANRAAELEAANRAAAELEAANRAAAEAADAAAAAARPVVVTPSNFLDQCQQIKNDYLRNSAVLMGKFSKFNLMVHKINKTTLNSIKNIKIKQQYSNFRPKLHEYLAARDKYSAFKDLGSRFATLNCSDPNSNRFLVEYDNEKQFLQTMEENFLFKDLYLNLLGIGRKVLRIKPPNSSNPKQIIFPIEGVIAPQANANRCQISATTALNLKVNDVEPVLYTGFTDIYYENPAINKRDTTEDIFNCEVKPYIDTLTNGNDLLFFVYGQSGSGKTYTLLGNDTGAIGILGYSIEYMLSQPEKFRDITVSIFQLYPNENGKMRILYILENGDITSSNPKIKKQAKKTDLTSSFLQNDGIGTQRTFYKFKDDDMAGLVPSVPLSEFNHLEGNNYGDKIQRFLTERRFQRSTVFNPDSSRSHAFIILNVNVDVVNPQTDVVEETKVKLLFIDLGGNELIRDVAPPRSPPYNEGLFITQTLNDLVSVVLKEFIKGRSLGAGGTQPDFIALMKYFLAAEQEKINKIVLFIHTYGYLDNNKDVETLRSISTTTKNTLEFFNSISNLDNSV